jgi:hypothetical protein
MSKKIIPVISSAQKLILKVQEGPVVSFPDMAIISDYGANNDTPQIVVFNGTDPSWQGAAAGDYVIVNEVPTEVAKDALIIYADGQTNEDLQAALDYLAEKGYVDQYTTNQGFVSEKLSPAGAMLKNGSGIVKRDDRDIVDAWKEDGVYYVAPNGEQRRIEPDILKRTYRNVDGSEIDLKMFG